MIKNRLIALCLSLIPCISFTAQNTAHNAKDPSFSMNVASAYNQYITDLARTDSETDGPPSPTALMTAREKVHLTPEQFALIHKGNNLLLAEQIAQNKHLQNKKRKLITAQGLTREQLHKLKMDGDSDTVYFCCDSDSRKRLREAFAEESGSREAHVNGKKEKCFLHFDTADKLFDHMIEKHLEVDKKPVPDDERIDQEMRYEKILASARPKFIHRMNNYRGVDQPRIRNKTQHSSKKAKITSCPLSIPSEQDSNSLAGVNTSFQ